MALNPLAYTENVVRQFLQYQLTAYPFADPHLYDQMRRLLSLEETRRTPLLNGPFVSLSQAFQQGAGVSELVHEGVLHPHMQSLVPYPRVYAHQELAMRAIAGGRTTLVSTGTGSGKTEAFLYPIISRCLQLRDEKAPSGVIAVIVYPMNALAEDQLQRLRGLLAGAGVPFAMYVGKTPERKADVEGERLPSGSSAADYSTALERARQQHRPTAVHPAEERCSREEIRTPGLQPRILLTNVKQLELLLTRHADIELFDGSRLEYLVFDEAHTYSGSAGAETAVLIRRLRSFCGRTPEQTVCVATSATLADRERRNAGREFAARFFGVDGTRVEVVTEQYEPDLWARPGKVTGAFTGVPADRLREVLAGLSMEDPGPSVRAFMREALGIRLTATDWSSALHRELAGNEVVFQIADALKARAKSMQDLIEAVSRAAGRDVPEEEVLCWLLLGAAARQADRPLLRPVVHAFVRGVAGAIVTFPEGHAGPRLWLSAEDEEQEEDLQLARLPVLTCSTCGQHYFEHRLDDFQYTRKAPEGGRTAPDGRAVWLAKDEANGGTRALLLDRLISADDEDGDPPRTAPAWLCRHCGAVHPKSRDRCDGCGVPGDLVELRVVGQDEDAPGHLSRCLSCGTLGRLFGGQFREPARPVRAVSVADVHVLAQEMLRHAERKRLLVFTDNRQEAAFQAGWMRDHARRFRLRALMWERIRHSEVSVGDLVAHLCRTLDADPDLSRALLPEVWEQYDREAATQEHEAERRSYLRIQVLREVTTNPKQRIGLEPWGRLRLTYKGLNPDSPFIGQLASSLGVDAEEFAEGVASLLDQFRRSMLVLDREGGIFSKFWMDGAPEISRGYLPKLRGVPQGMKLQRAPSDDRGRVKQWVGTHETQVTQVLRKWGATADRVPALATQIWEGLALAGVLVPSTLRGARGRALPATSGTYQLDADRFILHGHQGVWRCRKCRRTQTRPPLKGLCLTWRCDGSMTFEAESRDSYDLDVLDSGATMVRPREHSAQVPAEEREKIERLFKGDDDGVNVLVCTPTLELGVDIGSLDTVLMRNVPPLASNYWQRAGRAGRRHRMAVNVTYARPVTHDRAYFAEPLKMLHGSVEPPRFNLRNELMVRKHLHAVVLTRLQQLRAAHSGLPDDARAEIETVLEDVLPRQVRHFLFDAAGNVRGQVFDVSSLRRLVARHEFALTQAVEAVFAQGWPSTDAVAVTEERLTEGVRDLATQLAEVLRRLKRRLDWALAQLQRLEAIRRQKGSLEADEDALFARCDRLVKRLKGELRRQRQQAEGYDETNTFGVLAAEGFLPGYGLEVGSVTGSAQVPRYIRGARDFDLPRPPSVALREYVPGNLIYANNHRFVPRFYHLAPEQGANAAPEPLRFQVDVANQAILELGTHAAVGVGMGASSLRAVPICDVDLAHQSNISDEEEYRFQLAVTVLGFEQGRHGEGTAYRWGQHDVQFRKSVHFRLLNIGPSRRVTSNGTLGYPVCLVCGQSRSPFASLTELAQFGTEHRDRCGRPVEATGFYADVVADVLTFKDCQSREEAYSLAEAVRVGASQVLDMDREDLEVQVFPEIGRASADAVLYDPMPGGSGLIEQLVARFDEVVAAARRVTEHCPAMCERSCIDCLQTFRNAFYHKHLNRAAASSRFAAAGGRLVVEHPIPGKFPSVEPDIEDMPVNRAETLLRHLLGRAGMPEPEWHKQIDLGRPLNTTSPDCFWTLEDEAGLCVYLDGLSSHLHGNPATREQDRAIRDTLRSRGYEVIEIAATQLTDRAAMIRHFARIARNLIGRDRAREVRDDDSWFELPSEPGV